MNKLITLLFLFLSINMITAQTNEGKEFWFGFMEHRDVGQNSMVVMITSKRNTGGRIQIPGLGWSDNFTVSANTVTIINLPSTAEITDNEVVSNKGIQILSDDLVSVYIHQFHEARSEATIVLPTTTIGTAYYAVTYDAILQRNMIHPAEFLVVATRDETTITIQLSDVTKQGKAKGSTINIVLNEGETYLVQSRDAGGDLTGSFIEGDKRFAVFSGNSWVEVPVTCGARDNLLEQMIPLSTWGKQYLTVPTDKVDYDVFRILASEDETKVEVQGTTSQTYTLDKGTFVEYTESVASYIISDKPIMVVQYLIGSQCSGYRLGDPSMVVLNSVAQTRDTVTLFNSAFENITENFVNVITRTIDTDLIIFDGVKLVDRGIEFTAVGRNANFSYARVPVQAGAHTIISEGCGVIATAYGYGQVESYAYSGGASFSNINANPIPEGGCLNDTVFFDTGLSPNRFNFLWDLGDGITSSKAKFTHFFPELGDYPVQLILEDECLGTIDTLNRDLRISLRQAVTTDPDQVLCEAGAFQLGATDLAGATYVWEGPNGYFSEEQFINIPNASLSMDGRYSVEGIVSGCATAPAFMTIDILENPDPDLGQDAIICVKNLAVELAPGDFVSYQWQDNSSAATFDVPLGGGQYWVEVQDEKGCIGRDTVELIQQCPTLLFIPTVFSPNKDGQNDLFEIHGADIISMNLVILNRWGDVMYESSSLEAAWDGTFNGQEAAIGVYMYELRYRGYRIDSSIYSDNEYGTLTLVR